MCLLKRQLKDKDKEKRKGENPVTDRKSGSSLVSVSFLYFEFYPLKIKYEQNN